MSTAGGGTGSPGRRRRDLEDSRRSETAFLKSRVRVLQKEEEEEDKIRGLGGEGLWFLSALADYRWVLQMRKKMSVRETSDLEIEEGKWEMFVVFGWVESKSMDSYILFPLGVFVGKCLLEKMLV